MDARQQKSIAVSAINDKGAEGVLIPNEVGESGPERLRLEFLDGLRGLAALYVLLFHIRLDCNFNNLPAWSRFICPPISYGHFAVCVFIVLSGYCLMLPIARSPDRNLRGGVLGFARRRARRILPPYYGALIFSFAWAFLYEGSKRWTGHANDFSGEFSLHNIVAHFLLVWNLLPDLWLDSPNGPLWSVDSEWQIYFVFALVLLPVWRRFGNAVTLVLAFALGVGPHYLLPEGAARQALDHACSWFIVLFSLGMIGATLRFSRPLNPLVDRLPWGTMCAVLGLLGGGAIAVWHPLANAWDPRLLRHFTWTTDVLAGVASLCLIMFCTRSIDLRGRGHHQADTWLAETRFRAATLRVLESRYLVELGGFSYSLYLVHSPILTAWLYVVMHVPLPPILRFVAMWIGGILVSLSLAYLFSRWFERPFLSVAGPARPDVTSRHQEATPGFR